MINFPTVKNTNLQNIVLEIKGYTPNLNCDVVLLTLNPCSTVDGLKSNKNLNTRYTTHLRFKKDDSLSAGHYHTNLHDALKDFNSRG